MGITFDRKLIFNKHMRNVRKKTERVANKIINLMRKGYGRGTAFLRIVMNRVVAAAVLN